MVQQADTESGRLHHWFVNFINYFRSEYERLSEEEKEFMGKWMDYLTPSQIEVFWLKEPQFQLIVKTKFSDRPDMEITINGPYNSHEFFDKVDAMIKQPKWQRVIHRDELHKRIFGEETYAEHLARDLNRLVWRTKNHMFEANPHKGHGEAYTMADHDYVQTFIGNIADQDYVEEVNSLIENVRRNIAYNKEHPLPSPEEVRTWERPKPQGYGTHFFPPIIVGDTPKFSPSEMLRGLTVPFTVFGSKVLGEKFASIPIIVTKDGFIYIGISDKKIVLKLLNTVMAVGILRGLKLFVAREHELSEAGYDSERLEITGYTYSTDTSRSKLFEERMKDRMYDDFKRKEVPEQMLRTIIKEAVNIFNGKNHVDELRFMAESYTHFHGTEYQQSFMMSWIIIERHLFRLWKKWVADMNFGRKRTISLLNRGQGSVHYIIETLNIKGILSDADYDSLMEMKDKRNDFIHEGKQIAKEDAERYFNIAKDILIKKLNLQ